MTRIERVMEALRWVWFVVYVQVLWLMGSVVGLGVLGVSPAFFASVMVARRLLRPDADYFATREFIQFYRGRFWRSQVFGLVMALVALVGASDLIYLGSVRGSRPVVTTLQVLVISLLGSLGSALLLVGPTYIDRDLPIRKLPRLVLVGVADLPALLAIVLSGLLLGVLMVYQTGLFVCVGLGIFIFVIAWASSHFERHRVREAVPA